MTVIKEDHIFQELPSKHLREIATYLTFDPVIDGKLYSQLAGEDQLSWLNTNRDSLKDHFNWVGSSFLGRRKSYDEIVSDTARKIGAQVTASSSTADVEKAIMVRVWEKASAKMTEAQRAELEARIKEIASKHGKQFGKEFTGLAAIGAAQLSGFGVYMLGSTLLGAINGALGLGLGFGVFTGLSSLISVVIGPAGWALLGLVTIAKLGGPNYKKIIPAIIVVATYRARQQTASNAPTSSRGHSPAAQELQVAHGGPTVAEDSETRALDISKLERDIERATEGAKRDVRGVAVAHAPRAYTKRDKTIFCLQHLPLCQMAELLVDGKHFLDLTEEEQETVRQLVKERDEFLALQDQERKRQARRDRKKEQNEAKLQRRRRLKNKGSIEMERKKLRHAFPNLTFQDRAIETYFLLPQHLQILAYEQFGQMDRGNTDGKHVVPRTKPKVFQRDAGSDLRVYCRREGSSKGFVVCLIGTKGEQDRDYRSIQV